MPGDLTTSAARLPRHNDRALRVLLHDYGGYGFIAQLARELAHRGHIVHHVHSASLRSGKGSLSRPGLDPDSLTFSAISVDGSFDRYDVIDRLRLERAYAKRFVDTARAWRPDLVLAANTPLLILHWAHPQFARAGIRLVNWLQDVHSVAIAEDLGRRSRAVAAAAVPLLEQIESRLLRACAAVVPITSDFVPLLTQWRVPESRIHVVHNWAELHPPVERKNRFSTEHGLDDRVVLLYAGTLGLKHEPAQLLLLAETFRARPDVAVVVVSEGLGRNWLDAECRSRGLSNLVLVDFQPEERVPEMLGSGDVLLSMIRPNAAHFSVPSKILAYLVAGRAQLSAIPAENLAARTLEESGAGLVVDPGSTEAWLSAAESLLDNDDLRAAFGNSGRAYAEERFDIKKIGDRFEALLTGSR